MKRLAHFVTGLFAIFVMNAHAQDTAVKARIQVAVFTPLYLDSAFDEFSNYRYGMNFPKFINAGLEFYEGVSMAADSLDKENLPVDIFVYDTRGKNSTVQNTVSNPAFDSIDLIIGHVNASEARLLANTAAAKDIPFINATYPNDAGVSNNPNYIILNSTLLTHCNAMYKYIQKNHALNSVVLFRKKGTQEDRLQEYFTTITKNTNSVPLKIKFVTLNDNFTQEDVTKELNPDGTTVCIAGSLDLAFGELLAQHLAAAYAENPSILFGMPTWWDVADFSTPEFKGLPVIFTTPFYLSPTNMLANKLQTEYRIRYYSRPTEMMFRGYETLYHFVHLLQLNGKNFGSALSEKKYKVFNEFEIQPVLDPQTTTLDYFENKKIYFIRKVDGEVVAVY